MKKIVLTYGLLSGVIISLVMAFSVKMCYDSVDFRSSEILGFASMAVTFLLIFLGVKNYRDKYNDGIISFGQAFKVGFYISLVASTIYVITWMLESQFYPDFMEKYCAHEIEKIKNSGSTAQQIQDQTQNMLKYKELYKNPFLKALFTYGEILPVGIIVSLVSGLILKRKPKAEDEIS